MSNGMRCMQAVLLVLLLSAWAGAENWPRFRGSTGQGISGEKNVPAQWGPSSNIAWKTAIPGEGWSSPVVWEERVFVTTTLDKGTACHVICLDRESGKVLWDVEVFKQTPSRKEGRNSYATPTPVTDGQRVYVFFGGGGAAALGFDGKVAWRRTEEKFYSQHGLGASPILYKDLVIMPWDHSTSTGPEMRLGWQIPWDRSYVLALDKNTGAVRYKAARGMSRIGHMTPNIVDVEGKPQLISAAGDIINAFDPETGQRIWWVNTGGEGVTPSPVFGDGVVYSSSGFATPVGRQKIYPAIRAFRLGGQGDMTEKNLLWEQKRSVPMIPSLLLAENLIYSVKEDGILQCLNTADGEVIYRQRLEGDYSASPVFADGKIYFTNDNGNTTVLEAGREFKQIAYNELNERSQASVAISNGHIFHRTEKHLYCIGPKQRN